MQYKCLYIYIYIIFFSSACVFNVVVISIRNCFNKNNIMLISYIFEFFFFILFKHEEILPCEMWTTMCVVCVM